MKRYDHFAFRVPNRIQTAQFFIDAMDYRIQTEFDLNFPDGSTTKCIALEPSNRVLNAPWTAMLPFNEFSVELHAMPEIFVSDGDENSIVGKWVKERSGIGSYLHHIAIQCESVEETMKEWKEKKYVEFATEEILTCPGLKQIFSRPSSLTGIIYELIERGEHGFCKENVTKLILSSDLK